MLAMRRSRTLGAALGSLLALAPMLSLRAEAAGRLVVEPRRAVVDEPIWVCVERGSPPRLVHLDGFEDPPASWSDPRAAGPPARIHTSLSWPSSGPLELLAGLARPPRPDAASPAAHAGFLRPGEYVLSAAGFEPETLTVRDPTPAERREFALLARARGHRERGDSAQAARLLRDFLTLAPASPASDLARLGLLDVIEQTEYAGRPKLWLAEWVARHHQHCVVGAGLGRWLAVVGESEGRRALEELLATYGGTRAASAAADLLRSRSAMENDGAGRADAH